eukprot:3804035-Amphidinium_carterae.2
MNRARALGLPAHVQARIVKSLHSVGLYGAEAGGITAQGMSDLRDPQASADLNTVRVGHRRVLAGQVTWPLEERLWSDALKDGRGRGPMRNLRLMADRLGWVPDEGGWRSQGQLFSWDEAVLKAKWDSARYFKIAPRLLALVLTLKAWLPVSLLPLSGNSNWMARTRKRRGKLPSMLPLEVWHEEHAHSAFQVGDLCARCGEAVENLEHIVLHYPHWHKERRESALPASAQQAPACVHLHGPLPAPPPVPLPTHEPALVQWQNVDTVDGSHSNSSKPHFRRCGLAM